MFLNRDVTRHCFSFSTILLLARSSVHQTWGFSTSASYKVPLLNTNNGMPMTTSNSFWQHPKSLVVHYSSTNNMALWSGNNFNDDIEVDAEYDGEVDLSILSNFEELENKEIGKIKVDSASVAGIHPWFKDLINSFQNVLDVGSDSDGVAQSKSRDIFAHAAAALVFMSAFLLPLQQDAAWAAPSGGRMGGGGFSTGGGYSRSIGSPSSTRFASPNVYSRGFTQGYSTGYLSRGPTVARFGGGISPYYYGGGMGFNPLFVPRPAPIFGMPLVRGPGLFFGGLGFLPFAMFSWFLLQALSSMASATLSNKPSVPTFGRSNEDTGLRGNILNQGRKNNNAFVGDGATTVAQISIALDIPNRDDPSNILKYLNRLSESANTGTRQGTANLVNQVAVELLRQKDSIFASNTSYKNFRNAVDAQRTYENVVVSERSKFERETTNTGPVASNNSNNNKWKDMGYFGTAQATSAVVTLIVALDGNNGSNLPAINSASDVEKALAQIASDVKLNNALRSAEILWTPGEREDVLSRQDVFMDYPKLRNI